MSTTSQCAKSTRGSSSPSESPSTSIRVRSAGTSGSTTESANERVPSGSPDHARWAPVGAPELGSPVGVGVCTAYSPAIGCPSATPVLSTVIVIALTPLRRSLGEGSDEELPQPVGLVPDRALAGGGARSYDSTSIRSPSHRQVPAT